MRLPLLRALASLVIALCAVRSLMTYMPGSPQDLASFSVNSNETKARSDDDSSLRPGRSPYAYVFLVSGCDPDRPAYRYFLYNILVASRLLRETGSTSDIIAMFQMSYASSYTSLPEEDLRLLEGSNITQIQYIPKSSSESYYRTQFDKFRILGFTTYRRVLFMDADVMPVSNLDYLFQLSDSGVLKENVVVAGPIAPANGGFFLLKPGNGQLEELTDIVKTRERLGKGKGVTQFDKVHGWGHTIQKPDYWETRQRKRGQMWDFYAAFADQGLLYHWAKYAKKKVSIVVGGKVEQWEANSTGNVRLESSHSNLLQNFSKPLACWKSCLPVYGDHVHFGGGRKPWLRRPPVNLTASSRLDSAYHLWFWTLKEVDNEFEIGLNFKNWTAETPLLGMLPKKRQAAKTYIRLIEDRREKI